MKQLCAVGLVGTAIFVVFVTTPDAPAGRKARRGGHIRPFVRPSEDTVRVIRSAGRLDERQRERRVPLQRPDALTGKSVDQVDDSSWRNS